MHLKFDRRILIRSIRTAALLLFGVVSLYGLHLLFQGNWREVGAYWLTRHRLLALGFVLSATDILTDSLIWMLILRQLGISIAPLRAVLLFFSGYAGLLMPVQLGRFFRASELVRLGHAAMGPAIKAEIILLYFAAVAAVAVFAGAFLYRWSVLAMVLTPFIIIIMAMLVTDQFFQRLPQFAQRFSIQLPLHFWRQPIIIGLAFLAATGWLLNGTILYLIFRDVSETLVLHHTIMVVTSNLFVGVGTGLPGGLGISESYIGAMMYWLRTPPEHLVVAVAAFRVVTFWIWIPIGWCALLLAGSLFRPQKSS